MINKILAGATVGAPEPTVGMGATLLYLSDRYPATIIEVERTRAGEVKAVVVQEDEATALHTGGPTEQQRWEFAPNPDAVKRRFTRRKGDRFVEEGQSLKSGVGLQLGVRSKYIDPHF